MEENNIVPGFYKHFKGGLVQVLYVAKHSESLESMVVYKHNGDGSIWVRPASMWNEIVKDKDGNDVPRFKFIKYLKEELTIPNVCGECKYVGIYNSESSKNERCCCELLYDVTGIEHTVDLNAFPDFCPLEK